jgi:putative nucleotidyltransferase with HDIG domain
LLHDIGKTILYEFFRESYDEALEGTVSGAYDQLFDAEKEVIGVDHGEVGAMLLRRWKFPQNICDIIASHHSDRLPQNADPADVAILRVGDGLTQQVGVGKGGNISPPECLESDLTILDIGEDDLEAVRSHLDQRREGILAFFKAL